jgi:hypothetical protein
VKINPTSGGTGKGDREKEEGERDMKDKSVDRTVSFHLIYYKAQLLWM